MGLKKNINNLKPNNWCRLYGQGRGKDLCPAVTLQISKIQAGIREFIGQKEAHVRFGRQNIERWVKEGRLQRYKRPGKIEYRLEDLYKCALDPYDY